MVDNSKSYCLNTFPYPLRDPGTKLTTGCPGKFGIAKTAGLAEMVGSAINLGTQGGYTMVPQTSNLPPQKKFLL